jgi:hypothetical protein
MLGGKYKGDTFYNIYKNDKKYCEKMLIQHTKTQIMDDFKKYIKLYNNKDMLLEPNIKTISSEPNIKTMSSEPNIKTRGETILNFGQYKGKTYEYMINNEKRYCMWILENSLHTSVNPFKEYLNENFKNDYLSKINNSNIKNSYIDCTKLSFYYENDNNIIKLIKLNELKITKTELNFNIIRSDTIPSNIFGLFIDYLIRYNICKIQNKKFYDDKCDFFVKIHSMRDNYEMDESPIKGHIQDKDYWQKCEIIRDSYINCIELNASITDIYNMSLCHKFRFGDIKGLEYLNKNLCIDENDNNKLNLYIENKIKNKKNILCNPALCNSELKIRADADLIINDELIDFKISGTNIGENNKKYIQLLIYVCLYYKKTNIKCKKITILNLLLGYEYSIDISKWDYNNLLSILEERCK